MTEHPVDDNAPAKISWVLKTADGDETTVIVEGFTKGANAIRALERAGHPDNLVQLMNTFAEAGDMSIVALALELGEAAERLDADQRRR